MNRLRAVLRCGAVGPALLIGGGAIPAASAQAAGAGSAPAAIATDWAAITDSSAVVPNEVFQAENGVLDTCNQGPGIKQQLLSASGGFELAAIVSLSFPAGASRISSHGYDPSLQLPWWRPLSANWNGSKHAVRLCADSRWLPQGGRRVHLSCGSTVDQGLGRVYRIRRRFSARRGTAPPAARRNGV